MVDYDPYSDEVMSDPWPHYARLRDESPAHYLDRYDCWVFSRFEDIWNATTQTEIYTANRGVTPEDVLLKKEPEHHSFLTMDVPRHRAYRGLLSPSYTRRAIAGLEGRIRELTRQQLAPRVESGRLDVYRDIATPTATLMIAELIGIAPEDALEMREWVEAYFRREPGQFGTSPDGEAAVGKLFERAAQLAMARREQPDPGGDDHLSVWCRAEVEGQPMTIPEIATNVFGMFVTGAEVIPLSVAGTLYYLWSHPDQRRRVVQDPSLVPTAFDEGLRYDQPTNLLGRRLAKDTELHGQQLRADQGVLFLWASANRDDREFERADVFDIDRRPRRSLSYGHGIHKCIGEYLGRLEARVLLEEILAVAPDFEVVDSEAQRVYGEFLHGYHRLPVEFAPTTLAE